MINDNDCFANIGENKCHALKEKICNTRPCPFYKPKDKVKLSQIQREINYYSSMASLVNERIKT